jgi:hypothetical protein
MGSKAKIAEQIIRDSNVIDSRGETDTIRLWENYRDQALLWRAIALLQIPTSFVLAIFAFYLWGNSSITLNVPKNPLPGLYAAQEIPDTEFISVATNYINLIASYQPAVAQRQFEKARELLKEPMLANFDKEMINIELKAITNTSRTQLFFVDPVKTTVTRQDNYVTVTMTGERLKLVAGKQLPVMLTKYTVVMTTIPRNDLNPYGIVIENGMIENVGG